MTSDVLVGEREALHHFGFVCLVGVARLLHRRGEHVGDRIGDRPLLLLGAGVEELEAGGVEALPGFGLKERVDRGVCRENTSCEPSEASAISSLTAASRSSVPARTSVVIAPTRSGKMPSWRLANFIASSRCPALARSFGRLLNGC